MAAKPVVAGVDGSEASLLAVEWAAMEAGRHGLPLHLVSVPPRVPWMHAYPDSPAAAASAVRDVSARALLAGASRAGDVAPGLQVTTGLPSGPPALAVAGCGSGAAMLVVGSRGAGGFAAMTLGSVSRYAAVCAACPVIVVRQASMAVHQEVAVGIREPQDAGQALTFAFEEAAARHAGLVVIHTWHWFPPAPHALAEALDPWREKYPRVPARDEVIHGHPARVLADYSARADLVVIGRHGGSLIGSTQHVLLDHARGPVAVVPSGD